MYMGSQSPFRFLFLSGIAIVGVAPLGGTRAAPGPAADPLIAADFSGVRASTSLSLWDDPENNKHFIYYYLFLYVYDT